MIDLRMQTSSGKADGSSGLNYALNATQTAMGGFMRSISSPMMAAHLVKAASKFGYQNAETDLQKMMVRFMIPRAPVSNCSIG